MVRENRLVEWLLWIVIVMLAGCGALAFGEDGLALGERVDYPPMGFISVMAGVVYDCAHVECLVMAEFGEGMPMTVVGVIGGQGGLWYVVNINGRDGFVPAMVIRYDYRLNVTPTPIGRRDEV